MKIEFASIVNLFLFSTVLGTSAGYSHLYLFHICLVLLMATWFVLELKGVEPLFYKPTTRLPIFFLVMIFWYALSLLWSIEPSYTLRYLVYIILGVTVAYVIVGRVISEESYYSLYKLLKLAFLIEIIVALIEIFTPLRLPTSPYSQYASFFHREGADFDAVTEEMVVSIKSMPTAFHGNPNNLAVTMTTIMPFFLFYHRVLVKVIGTLSIFVIIMMAGSRGAFIGALFGVALYVAVTQFRRFLTLFFIGILVSSILAVEIDNLKESESHKIAEFAYTAEVLAKYLNEEDETSGGSISLRRKLIKNGFDALYATGGLGVGGGGSFAVQEKQGGEEARLRSMHNFWIEVLVDSGVGFFLLFVVWYLYVAFSLLSIYFKSTWPFYKYHAGALFLSFSMFSVSCISASSVIYHLPMWLMFGMAMALINIWQLRCSLVLTEHVQKSSQKNSMVPY